jgi:DNA excision repair protein ERCC-4
MKIPAEPKPSSIVAIQDTREQCPWDLSPLRTEISALSTGDYSVKGLTDVIAVERKSLVDLLACLGVERERFQREMQRLLAYPTRAVICECTWQELQAGNWNSRITPAAAVGSVLGWMSAGVPFIFCSSHEEAGRVASRILYITARRRWREARGLFQSVFEPAEETV